MKIDKRLLLICIAIPVLTGVIAGILTGGGMETFADVNKPPLSPPGWLFPVVWTILYTLMGISSYIVITSGKPQEQTSDALRIYIVQLAVNFMWPFLFFTMGWYLFAFMWLVLLWILVFIMIVMFKDISKLAAYLNIPYLLWLTFAGYLNFAIWILN